MATRDEPVLRIGLIGAGFSARLHAHGYRHVHGVRVEIAAVTAARPERAAAFAAEFGAARAVGDARAILDDQAIHAVDICAPSHLHAPLAIEAARAGKHVIVEKPLTGFFGPAATPRETMLRQALGSADQVSRPAARPACGSATRRTGCTRRPSRRRAAFSPPRAGPSCA